MKSHPNYLTILYNRALVYIHILKKIYLAKIKGIPSNYLEYQIHFL